MSASHVVLESTKNRTVLDADGTGLDQVVSSWVKLAVKASRDSGKCVAFTVSVHGIGEECDHEMEKR